MDDLGPDTPGDSHSGIQTNKLSNRSDQTHVTYEDSAFSERHEQSNKHVYNQNQEPDSNTPSPQPTKASDKRTDKDVSEEAIKQRAKNSVREGKDFERVVERERSEIYDDLAYASVGVPRLHRDWEHKYFKILVCGESGLGKLCAIIQPSALPLTSNPVGSIVPRHGYPGGLTMASRGRYWHGVTSCTCWCLRSSICLRWLTWLASFFRSAEDTVSLAGCTFAQVSCGVKGDGS